jgi:hypothetical protein
MRKARSASQRLWTANMSFLLVANWLTHWVVVLVGDLSDDILLFNSLLFYAINYNVNFTFTPHASTSTSLPSITSSSLLLSVWGFLALPAGGCDPSVCF